MISVGKYRYYYGAGSEPNREIRFEKETDTSSIQATVYARIPQGWKEISKLSAESINIEMLSTTAKVKMLIAQRQNPQINSSILEKQKLSQFSSTEQSEFVNKLEPKGTWRLEITNETGCDPQFEKISNITFFDPT